MADYKITSFTDNKVVLNYKGSEDITLKSIVKIQFVTLRHKDGVTKGFSFDSLIRFIKEDGNTFQYPRSKINLSETESFLKDKNAPIEHLDEFM
ncbi:hypothetical protein H6F38_13950 [Paenibacillus sp. EKM208P]|nr:hypothetical protein H6F38_13950 [Paenibacillus sp. EKM208P]